MTQALETTATDPLSDARPSPSRREAPPQQCGRRRGVPSVRCPQRGGRHVVPPGLGRQVRVAPRRRWEGGEVGGAVLAAALQREGRQGPGLPCLGRGTGRRKGHLPLSPPFREEGVAVPAMVPRGAAEPGSAAEIGLFSAVGFRPFFLSRSPVQWPSGLAFLPAQSASCRYDARTRVRKWQLCIQKPLYR